jgi:hypothetical protein
MDSFELEPKADTPEVSREHIDEPGSKLSWRILTGKPEGIEVRYPGLGVADSDSLSPEIPLRIPGWCSTAMRLATCGSIVLPSQDEMKLLAVWVGLSIRRFRFSLGSPRIAGLVGSTRSRNEISDGIKHVSPH